MGDIRKLKIYEEELKGKKIRYIKPFTEGMFVRDCYDNFGFITDVCECNMCKERGFLEPTVAMYRQDRGFDEYNVDYISDCDARNNFTSWKQIGTFDSLSLSDVSYIFNSLLESETNPSGQVAIDEFYKFLDSHKGLKVSDD